MTETEAVRLWIWNDEGYYSYWLTAATMQVDLAKLNHPSYLSTAETARYDLSKQLEEFFRDEENPLADQATVYSDLLGHALGRVDWLDLAQDIIDAAKELA